MSEMTPLAMLREIRADAERDVAATDGRTMNGRVMGEYIGNTAALICALSSVMEDMLMRMQTVGPDDVVLVTVPADVDPEVHPRLVDRLLALGLADRFVILGGGITVTVATEVPASGYVRPRTFEEDIVEHLGAACLPTEPGA